MNVFKLNKIIFSFLIIFSFFQVCNDSFARETEAEKQKRIAVEEKKKADYFAKNKKSYEKDAQEQLSQDKKSREDAENKKIDNRIDLKIQIIIIGLILSLLINIIFILFYFIVNKKINQKIDKLKNNYKSQKDINEKNIEHFVNTNKYIVSFRKNLDNLQTEIKHINKAINFIQTLEIEYPKNKDPLREKMIKDNNNYELEVNNSQIKEICNNHFKMTNREFRKKYFQDLKIIEISDDIEKEKPIFETSSTGKYIAIKENNEKYLIFYSKGTNITSENHSVISIFTLDQEIEKDKIYENWKINKPAVFLLNNDDTWSIQEKGIINLDFNKEEFESNILIDFETKKDVLINDNKNNDKFEQKKTHIELIKEVLKNHFDMSYWEFMKKYPNAVKLDITNTDDVIYKGYDPIFNESEQGIYIAISFLELNNSKYYLFYPKETNITSKNIELKTVFNFEKEPEKGKIYDNWMIIQPAILINNNNGQIIKKGKIEL